jgi:hypothetical protein
MSQNNSTKKRNFLSETILVPNFVQNLSSYLPHEDIKNMALAQELPFVVYSKEMSDFIIAINTFNKRIQDYEEKRKCSIADIAEFKKLVEQFAKIYDQNESIQNSEFSWWAIRILCNRKLLEKIYSHDMN